MGGLLGGPKGMLAPPPSQIIGGAWPPLAPPLPTPMLHGHATSSLRRRCSAIHFARDSMWFTFDKPQKNENHSSNE